MKLMIATVVLAVSVICVGCASSDSTTVRVPEGETPVATTGTGPTEVGASERGVIPVGQELDVRLQNTLDSETAQVEQRFEATTLVDLTQDGAVLVPAGSRVRGYVSAVDRAGNIDRTGSLTLAFDQITVKGRDYPVRGMATQVFESRGIRDEAATVGTAGAVGAIVGGIIGGLKGAIVGAVVGSGGVIAATEGKDVELPAGSIVRIRLDSPVKVR